MITTDLIRNHFPFFVEKELQSEILLVGSYMEVRAGEQFIDFGQYPKMIPLILEGSIKVSREDDEGNELFLYYLNAGESCTMTFSCCMMHKKSAIRAIAEDDTKLIGIPIRYMDEWMNKYTSWKNFVMRSYDERLYEMVKTIDSIAFKKMDERLLSYLQQKSNALQSKTIAATHQEIAFDLNASREAISRLLKQLERSRVLRLGRNKVELL